MKTFTRSLFVSIFLFGAVLSASCGEKTKSTPSKTEEASKSAKPGSHEDWCDEHGVPESQCTKCNPSLVAAFKASGDWCAEHSLPESQCTKCNPNLKIERPAKE